MLIVKLCLLRLKRTNEGMFLWFAGVVSLFVSIG